MCDKRRGKYINYKDPEQVNNLNQNVMPNDKKISTFEKGLYPSHLDARVMWDPYFLCSVPRDTTINYIYPNERQNHPDHFSRFAYADCPNGYCFGPIIGKYNTGVTCSADVQPQGLAPSRLYPTNTYESQDDPAYVHKPSFSLRPKPSWANNRN